jgi:hypothetical protein
MITYHISLYRCLVGIAAKNIRRGSEQESASLRLAVLLSDKPINNEETAVVRRVNR